MPDEEDLRGLVLRLGERNGLSADRLEGSSLVRLMVNTPPGWSQADRAAAMVRLITELVSELASMNLRSAAQVALNLGARHSPDTSAAERWRAFASAQGNTERTARNWWYEAATVLARIIPARIAEVSSAGDWPKYRVAGVSGRPSNTLPPYRFVRVDSSYWFKGRVGVRSISNRRIAATEDGVDRVLAIGRYYADPRPGAATIRPLMNCQIQQRRSGRGMAVADIALASTLRQGEETFYSYATEFNSERESEPLVTHEVTAASVGLFVARVQFDVTDMPDVCWFFAARTSVEAMTEPEPHEVDRFVPVNRIGYVEHRFPDCEYGITYGLGWRWNQADDPGGDVPNE